MLAMGEEAGLVIKAQSFFRIVTAKLSLVLSRIYVCLFAFILNFLLFNFGAIFYDFILTVFLAHHYYLLILVTRIHLRHKAIRHESHDRDKVSQLALIDTILILLENAEELSIGNLHN